MFENTLEFAKKCDASDTLTKFRSQFLFPQHKGKNFLYFCGNSLGLQPQKTATAIQQELEDWATFGVEGHFMGRTPWYSYHETVANGLAHVVGALPHEVVAMNSLTVNLHLLMVSFYKPTAQKFKIMIEPGAFPSDQYAVASQAQHHGFNAAEAILEPRPSQGGDLLLTSDILNCIEQNAESLALILLGGINYKTGQAFDINAIVKKAHEHGITVGLDLAHAAGNLKLSLHDSRVDFAAWCSYKYLNAGPGGIAAAFIHEHHAKNTKLNRFAGWWGHDKTTRFKMQRNFEPMPTAEGWQLSNPPIFQLAALKASLELFLEAGITNLRQKSQKLTSYLEYQLKENMNDKISIITPSHPDERGCQLSIRVKRGGVRDIQQKLLAEGVICDIREPDIMRIAPVPLYNSFEDVFVFTQILKGLL